ncbi:hypothetical protein V5O48_006924 [Marasmius crinis-equi]|uniref:laccase n=1 Tax=Marasmius crinis-equi TaxID=585013 RepID=A0ABR3FIL0_9AGAR
MRLSRFSQLLSVVGFVESIYAVTLGPQAELTIANSEIAPDGKSRPAVLANGIFPGPVLTATTGELFEINVKDDLTDKSMFTETSIHWHGLFAKGMTWADGASGISQCPISPGHSFKYEIDTDDQWGTFWYHSHFSTQYCDGLRGVMVVYNPDDHWRDLYDVDDESTIITLADWYRTYFPSTTYKGPMEANSTLINGLGRYKGGPSTDLAVINVEQGKRLVKAAFSDRALLNEHLISYRLRVVSLACDPNFNFSIDGHTMQVIEVDSIDHEPINVDSIQIFAGIRANPSAPGRPGFEGGINSAILRYKGAPESEPKVDRNVTTNPLKETDLHPLDNPGAPGEPTVDGADVSFEFKIGFDQAARQFSINNESFVPPTVPVLLQILSGARTAQELLPIGSVYSLPLNKTIQISMPGGGTPGSPHPMHLHGHAFDVIRTAGSTEYNYKNPVRRDVVNTGSSAADNVTIRFRTDNAGPWFLHCHIDQHMALGLAVVLAEDTSSTELSNPIPDEWDELCPIYNALPKP